MLHGDTGKIACSKQAWTGKAMNSPQMFTQAYGWWQESAVQNKTEQEFELGSGTVNAFREKTTPPPPPPPPQHNHDHDLHPTPSNNRDDKSDDDTHNSHYRNNDSQHNNMAA